MTIRNSYPQLPEIPYKRTEVEMKIVISLAQTLVSTYSLEVVRAAYCIFRNESANGKSGVNENYVGLQGDQGMWDGLDLTNVIGTCVKIDGAGENRRFICFNENGYKESFEFLCKKVQQRGIYIGALGVESIDDLAGSYQHKWVSNPIEDTPDAREDFKNLYKASKLVIP